MAGIIASKTMFYILYIFIFTVGVLLVSSFINVEGKYLLEVDNVKDSVVINRVIKCFSYENKFGILDENKIDEGILKKCIGEDSNIGIKLIRMDGKDKTFKIGNLDNLRTASRYVLVENKGAKLEVSYNAA